MYFPSTVFFNSVDVLSNMSFPSDFVFHPISTDPNFSLRLLHVQFESDSFEGNVAESRNTALVEVYVLGFMIYDGLRLQVIRNV